MNIKGISKNLTILEEPYNDVHDPLKKEFISKMAILELCGWIEESQDEIINKYIERNIDPGQQKNWKGQIVGKNYSFEYDNFRGMMIRVIGISRVIKLEAKISAQAQQDLKTIWSNLKKSRNELAHTYLKRMTKIDSPSITKSKVNDIHESLKLYKKYISRMK